MSDYRVVVSSRPWWISQIPDDKVVYSEIVQYIVDAYDALPDYVVFLDKEPYDLFTKIPLDMKTAIYDEMGAGYTVGTPFLRTPWDVVVLDQISEIRIESFFAGEYPWDKWSIGPKFIEFSLGNQYIVPKQCILARPLEFYKNLQKIDSNTVGYLFKYIFDPEEQLQFTGTLG